MKIKSLLAKTARVSPRRGVSKASLKTAVLESIHGKRVGTKKRDTRWQAPDGTIWASRFEYEVFYNLHARGLAVRKTDKRDSQEYRSSIQQGICLDCKSEQVAQRRSYTPDLYFERDNSGTGDSYYIEAKGYIRGQRRALLRAFVRSNPDFPLRLVVQKDYKVTAQLSLTQWAAKYLKIPVHVWNGSIPEDWK